MITYLLIIFFACSLIHILYVYFGYPLIIYILGANKKVYKGSDNYQPMVSVVIAAYNEEEVIADTVNNKLKQNYPSSKIEIIVISDCSVDNTDSIVKSISKENKNVKLYRQESRQGKTMAVNKALDMAGGEIIVFSDANSIYEDNAIRELVKNFSNPDVGYVTGKMVYVNETGSIVGDGCSAYMKYENFIRKYETRFNSVIGVDGGIDAVRRTLYTKMQEDQLPDFVQPLHILEKGYKVIYEEAALLYEKTTSTTKDEYRMRVRVTLRSLWSLYYFRNLLNPFYNFKISWQLISHKLLRYFIWISLIVVFISNIYLYSMNALFECFLYLQITFYLLALLGFLFRNFNLIRIVNLVYYFVVINVACLHAFAKFLKQEKQVIWNPRSG